MNKKQRLLELVEMIMSKKDCDINIIIETNLMTARIIEKNDSGGNDTSSYFYELKEDNKELSSDHLNTVTQQDDIIDTHYDLVKSLEMYTTMNKLPPLRTIFDFDKDIIIFNKEHPVPISRVNGLRLLLPNLLPGMYYIKLKQINDDLCIIRDSFSVKAIDHGSKTNPVVFIDEAGNVCITVTEDCLRDIELIINFTKRVTKVYFNSNFKNIMLARAGNLKQIYFEGRTEHLNLRLGDTHKLTTMTELCSGLKQLLSLDISNTDCVNIKPCYDILTFNEHLKFINLGNFKISNAIESLILTNVKGPCVIYYNNPEIKLSDIVLLCSTIKKGVDFTLYINENFIDTLSLEFPNIKFLPYYL